MKLTEQLNKQLNEGMESKLVRVSNSVVVKFEAHMAQAMRDQTIIKIKTFAEIHGKRPFNETDYKTVASAIFSTADAPKPLEMVDEVFVTETPVDDAKKWAKDKIKNYKKL